MMCAKRVSQSVMDRSVDATDVETLPPDRALSLLSNETRIEILRALAVTDEEAVSFSTLRKRVGTDDSGQFNYHLNRLTGHYVQRTTDGYALCQAGTDALEAISKLGFAVQ